jgi:hypothetical protein
VLALVAAFDEARATRRSTVGGIARTIREGRAFMENRWYWHFEGSDAR